MCAAVTLVLPVFLLLPVPLELLYQYARLVVVLTVKASFAVFSGLAGYAKELTAASVFGLILVCTVGLGITIIVGIITFIGSILLVAALPFLYGLCTVFRIFILSPPVWGSLRRLASIITLELHQTEATGVFCWRGKERVDNTAMLDLLFGPKYDKDAQIVHSFVLLAGTLVFEFV